jgi:hypothetical protein
MKYSFYQYFNEDGNIFRLYIQTPNSDFVRCYEFKTDIEGVSDEPGITRLFGKEIFDVAGNYFLFPLDFNNVEVGDFVLLQEDDKFTRLNFVSENNVLQGEWLLRRLSTGDILFWKPFPAVFTAKNTSATIQISDNTPEVEAEQKFSLFELTSDGGSFDGIAVAEGVWTGQDFHTTLFTKDIIEEIFSQMDGNLENMLVDYNHNMISDGQLKGVTLHEDRGIKYIRATGTGNQPIPAGSGLSLLVKSKLKWDNNLNVFVLVKAETLGLSIITENNPACTLCMIR